MRIEAAAADIAHLGGALIVVVSVVSMGEVIRICRYLNILLGLIVAVAPWFVQDGALMLNISGAVTGLLVAALSIPRGPRTEAYGSWDGYVR